MTTMLGQSTAKRMSSHATDAVVLHANLLLHSPHPSSNALSLSQTATYSTYLLTPRDVKQRGNNRSTAARGWLQKNTQRKTDSKKAAETDQRGFNVLVQSALETNDRSVRLVGHETEGDHVLSGVQRWHQRVVGNARVPVFVEQKAFGFYNTRHQQLINHWRQHLRQQCSACCTNTQRVRGCPAAKRL